MNKKFYPKFTSFALFSTFSRSKWLLLLLIFSLLIRIWRIDFPNSAVFDEIYYPYTAKAYLSGNPDAWVYTSTTPKEKTFAIINPPLPQETMAFFMKLFNSQALWASRLPSVFLGTLSVYLVYKLGLLLFKSWRVSMLAAFLFSIDGLNFVQSRTAMLDIYLVTFILLSLIFFFKKNLFLSSIFLGLGLASKWSALYLIFVYLVLLPEKRKIMYFLISPFVYFLFYIPFFLTGHSFIQFINLAGIQISYHMLLKSTHDYASLWWSWPLNLYPVWYYFDTQKNMVSNIFVVGNSSLFWLGTLSIFYSFIDTFKKRSVSLLIILLLFFTFWLPWIGSPRITFFYYFAPSIPFLCLSLSYQLNNLWEENSQLAKGILIIIFINFIIFYPILTGIFLSKTWFF